MNELRGVARVMGMKYFRHLSKLELHHALQRQLHHAKKAQVSAEKSIRSFPGKGRKRGQGTRRFWWRKSKKKGISTEETPMAKEQNTVDPIMLTELGPYTVSLCLIGIWLNSLPQTLLVSFHPSQWYNCPVQYR
jgi:hypothetical protein